MMDLKDQLKQLFPDHKEEEKESTDKVKNEFWMQSDPLICKFEKRKGKPNTVIEGYTGAAEDFKKLTKLLQTAFSTGGSFKNDIIVIQGDFREAIMELLKDQGFAVKRVGG